MCVKNYLLLLLHHCFTFIPSFQSYAKNYGVFHKAQRLPHGKTSDIGWWEGICQPYGLTGPQLPRKEG